jgi:hypothetical protein
MKNHKQDDDDYQPAKKTKSKPGPNSGPKTALKPASQKAAPKSKPRQRVRTPSLDPVGASAQILIPTPKQLNRPAKKITPHVPQQLTDPKDDFNWDIDDASDGAAGPSFTAKKEVKTGRKKLAPKKPRFGPLELESDVTTETPAVLKRNTLVAKMAETAKKTAVSPEKPVASVKETAQRGRQRKENKEDEVDVVQDSRPMEQTNVGDLDAELPPQETNRVKSRGSSRLRKTDNKENEDVEVVEDSYPTDPKLKQNLGTKLTQALADCELLSEAQAPPAKNLTQRLGFGMQQQVQSPPTASVNSPALPQQFDPSMVDEHANRKPNLVGWNRKGPTNQGVSPRKKLLRVPSATVNEQGSPIVGSVDPRLRHPPREVLDLTQLPDTSEFASDYIGQSNDDDEVMAEPTQTVDPRVLDRSGGREPSERFSFSGNNRSIPSTTAPAQLPESSIYAQDNFYQTHDEDGVSADSVLSEDAVDLVPTQVVVPTQLETISKPRPVPIVGATAETNLPLLPNRLTLKPTSQSRESVLPLTRANMETLKSIAQNVLTSPDAAVPVKSTEVVVHKSTRVVTNVAFENKPTLPPPQDPLKRRISWQEDIPSKKVKDSRIESTKLPTKPEPQQQPTHEQNDSQNAVESQAKPLPQVQRMQPTEHTLHDKKDSQNAAESQAKPLPKVQRMKAAEPTSHYQTIIEDETRNAAPAKNFEAAQEDQPSIGSQSVPNSRASDNRLGPKTFDERLKQRFAKPAPPLPKSPPRPAVQTKVPQRQKLARRPAISPTGEHRYAPEPRGVQVPTTPPHQYTTERDMDVTLVESDTDKDEEFEEYVESIEEDQFVEYLSSDSAAEAEEVVEHEEGTATPDRAPGLSEHQNAVNEALHKLADVSVPVPLPVPLPSLCIPDLTHPGHDHPLLRQGNRS